MALRLLHLGICNFVHPPSFATLKIFAGAFSVIEKKMTQNVFWEVTTPFVDIFFIHFNKTHQSSFITFYFVEEYVQTVYI